MTSFEGAGTGRLGGCWEALEVIGIQLIQLWRLAFVDSLARLARLDASRLEISCNNPICPQKEEKCRSSQREVDLRTGNLPSKKKS